MIVLEKIMFLRKVPLFEQIPSAELARIAEVTDELVIPSGRTVFDEGDYGDALFIIADGRVSISAGGKLVATLEKPNYFGEMSLLDGEPRSAGVRADQDTLLLRISQKDFQGILKLHSEASLAVIKTLSQRLRAQLHQPNSGGAEGAR